MTDLSVFDPPDAFELLFVARFVNEDPDSTRDTMGQYPRYHREIRDLLQGLLPRVTVTDTAIGIDEKIRRSDYVFSFLHRLPMQDGELYVSALCEFHQTPYLGSYPSMRALAGDKYMAKAFVTVLDIPTPKSLPVSSVRPAPDKAPFPGPYFVKPRHGAGSEHISEHSRQDDWSQAIQQANALCDLGLDGLVEEFFEGENITVPVIGGDVPIVLPPVRLDAPGPHGIITRDIKMQSDGEMHFRTLDDPLLAKTLRRAARDIYMAMQPLDYVRIDFRINRDTQEYRFLEMNICCDISSFGSFMFGAEQAGYDQRSVISHILAKSWERQKSRPINPERRLDIKSPKLVEEVRAAPGTSKGSRTYP